VHADYYGRLTPHLREGAADGIVAAHPAPGWQDPHNGSLLGRYPYP
jgi:hypothetical protein